MVRTLPSEQSHWLILLNKDASYVSEKDTFIHPPCQIDSKSNSAGIKETKNATNSTADDGF